MKGEVIVREPSKNGNGAVLRVPKRWLGWLLECKVLRRAEGPKRPVR